MAAGGRNCEDVEVPEPHGNPSAVLLHAASADRRGVGIAGAYGSSAGDLDEALRREIQKIDSNLILGEVITMRDQVGRTTAVQRTALGMLAVFGGLALLLAGVGLYGVMSYTVSQRMREFGLRMALGADTADLLRGVIRHGLTLTAAGILLGIAVAMVLTKLVANLLYHVSPRDPLTFGAAGVVMAIAALTACLVPAWRASRTDPVRALRS